MTTSAGGGGTPPSTAASSSPAAASPAATLEHCRGMSWSPPGSLCSHRYVGDLPPHAQLVLDPSRPHTISSAYERLHVRSALTERTFEPMLQQQPHHHHHHHPLMQGPHPACCGGGGVVPNPYVVLAHHRSLAMVAPRPRPHSLSRDVKIDDIIYQTRKGQLGPTTATGSAPVDGCQQPQCAQNIAVSESNSSPHSTVVAGRVAVLLGCAC